MITLTSPKALPANANRWNITRVDVREDENYMLVTVTLRTPAATNNIVSTAYIEVRNGTSTKVSYVAPISGLPLSESLAVSPVSTPTGFDDAMNVWRAGGTNNARKTALEAHLLTANIVDSASMGGT